MSVSVSIPTQSQQSARVRNVLGAVVERQASIMANADNVSLNDILTNPQRQGHAAALKTIADTASVVFDWESQRTPGIILIGDVEQSEPEDQPIEVSGVTVEPEVIADTTTGSVQPQ